MASLIRRYYTARDGTRTMARKWYGEYRDAGGNLNRVPLHANKSLARQMLAKLVENAALEKAGLRPALAEHQERPLSAHLDDWHKALEAKDNTAEYVALKVGRARALFQGCGFGSLGDVAPEKAEAWLAELRRGGASVQTSNHYLDAAKAAAGAHPADAQAFARHSKISLTMDRYHHQEAARTARAVAAMPAIGGKCLAVPLAVDGLGPSGTAGDGLAKDLWAALVWVAWVMMREAK